MNAVVLVVASCSGGGDQDGSDAGPSTTAPATTATSSAAPSSDSPSSAAPSSDVPTSAATSAESALPLQPDWPLGGIWLASGLDSDGVIIDPRLAFSTDDVAVAAVVALGADVPDSATLLVEWFRVGIDERVPLFTHEIPVGPRGLAVSRGAAPGGLAPGFYQVVATLGEHQTMTPWVVREAEPASSSADGLRMGLPTRSAPAPEPPSDDDYDWTGERGTPLGPEPPPGPCAPREITAHTSPITSVYAWADWAGICTTLKITAAVSGPPATLFSGDVSEFEIRSGGTPNVDVCDLPGGSDMPGTVVHFDASIDGEVVSEDLVLPDRGPGVLAEVDSIPPAGSLVEPGQSIALRALGMQIAPALGIETLELFALGQQIGTTGNATGSTEPIACDAGRFFALLESEYVVPDPLPPVIEICAVATTFDDHEGRGCVVFTTGEVWTGSYAGTLTWDCNVLGQRSGTLDGTFTITVAPDGAATMEIVHTVTGSCGGPDVGTLTTPLTIAGKRTQTGFEFPDYFAVTDSITLTASDDRATGTLTGAGDGGSSLGTNLVNVVVNFEAERS
ncbi:MAG TPA: hypothetical protein VNO51_19600 [Ilumatobacteraceae bacterium]|nr:hypothetical protein [Ilumatobacteraceae bacterium]